MGANLSENAQAGPLGPTSTGFPGGPADQPSAPTAGQAPWQPARLCFIADPDDRSGALHLHLVPQLRLPQPASPRIELRPFPSMGAIRGGRRHPCKHHRGVPVARLEKHRECPCTVRTKSVRRRSGSFRWKGRRMPVNIGGLASVSHAEQRPLDGTMSAPWPEADRDRG